MKTFTERKAHRVSTRQLILDFEKSLLAFESKEAEEQGETFDYVGRQSFIDAMERGSVKDHLTHLI